MHLKQRFFFIFILDYCDQYCLNGGVCEAGNVCKCPAAYRKLDAHCGKCK